MHTYARRILIRAFFEKSGKRPPTLLGVEYFTDISLIVLRASSKFRLDASDKAKFVPSNRYCTCAAVCKACGA